MFGKKKKAVNRWKVKISSLSDAIPFDIHNNEFEIDLTRQAYIDITAKVIDCDNGETCETSADGGFRIEVTPIS